MPPCDPQPADGLRIMAAAALPLLPALLSDPDPDVRVLATEAALGLPGEAATQALIPVLLSDPDANVCGGRRRGSRRGRHVCGHSGTACAVRQISAQSVPAVCVRCSACQTPCGLSSSLPRSVGCRALWHCTEPTARAVVQGQIALHPRAYLPFILASAPQDGLSPDW